MVSVQVLRLRPVAYLPRNNNVCKIRCEHPPSVRGSLRRRNLDSAAIVRLVGRTVEVAMLASRRPSVRVRWGRVAGASWG